jgi:hypothetical protein
MRTDAPEDRLPQDQPPSPRDVPGGAAPNRLHGLPQEALPWRDGSITLPDLGGHGAERAAYGSHVADAIRWEQAGGRTRAVEEYEVVVAHPLLNRMSSYPYERLMVLYRRELDLDKELRVVEQCMAIRQEYAERYAGRRAMIQALIQERDRLGRSSPLK